MCTVVTWALPERLKRAGRKRNDGTVEKDLTAFGSVSVANSTNLEGLGGFEPPTYGLGNRCSIHLSYRPLFFIALSQR